VHFHFFHSVQVGSAHKRASLLLENTVFFLLLPTRALPPLALHISSRHPESFLPSVSGSTNVVFFPARRACYGTQAATVQRQCSQCSVASQDVLASHAVRVVCGGSQYLLEVGIVFLRFDILLAVQAYYLPGIGALGGGGRGLGDRFSSVGGEGFFSECDRREGGKGDRVSKMWKARARRGKRQKNFFPNISSRVEFPFLSSPNQFSERCKSTIERVERPAQFIFGRRFKGESVERSSTCYGDKDVDVVFARGETVTVQEDDGEGGTVDKRVTKKIPLSSLRELNGAGGVLFHGGHELRSDAFVAGNVKAGAKASLKTADGTITILGKAASANNSSSSAPCFAFDGGVAGVDLNSSQIVFLAKADQSGRLFGPSWFRVLSHLDDALVGLLYVDDIANVMPQKAPFAGLTKGSPKGLFR